jgi:putative protease
MAVEFLKQLHPKLIVTDNTGIAFEAYKSGIAWIAGPGMNTINSFGLLCLRENFNCFGAFISNEISKSQLKGIKRPNDFKLYYSIYHPIMLMTSRQCLFQTITACRKEGIDDSCIRECEKSETITNFKKEIFYVEKSKGDYHRIYNGINYLNADVIDDFPELFSGFCIDLRNIKTGTNSEFDKAEVIKLFKHLVNGDQGMKDELRKVIFSTTKEQYAKGI